MKYDFSYIINPISKKEFLNTYYEKRPLLIKRENNKYYKDILNIGIINNYFNQADIIYPTLRLVKEADEISPQNFTYSITTTPIKSTEGIVEKEKMFHYFFNGYTIILNSFERNNLNILNLRHIVERTFYTRAQANIYLTPFNSQGFNPHWDNHDVFILQVGGSKEWKIYDCSFELPSRREFFEGNWIPTEPTIATILEEGDLLYIPRGFVHEAKSNDSISAHITLGLFTYTYGDLLRLIVEDVEKEISFRKSLPENYEIDRDEFLRNIIEFLSNTDIQKSITKLQDLFLSKCLTDPTDRLMDYMTINSLNMKTVLRKRESIFYDIKYNKENIVIKFNNKLITLPAFVTSFMKFILSNEQFCVEKIECDLEDSSKILLCRKLIEEGFLIIIKQQSN